MQYPHSVERYMIDPKAFMKYGTKVLQFNSILQTMSNTPWIAYAKNDLTHGVL